MNADSTMAKINIPYHSNEVNLLQKKLAEGMLGVDIGNAQFGDKERS